MKSSKVIGRPMKPMSMRRGIRLLVDLDVKVELDAMAIKERRTVGNFVEVLIDEALLSRKKRRS